MRALALSGALLATLGVPATADARRASSHDATERRIIRLVNKNRALFNLPPLHKSRALGRSANAHSRDMLRRNFFAHNSSNGTPFDRRVRRYRRAARIGENLAYVAKPRRRRGGQARTVVNMWMNSPAHRAVILNRGFRSIGIGRRSGRLGSMRVTVFTADFASRR
ncbi:MAG TPA: CAP domain-containing protein [Solirubrobacteraceae bacterium]|jgi:uncharacterized protein YkwD